MKTQISATLSIFGKSEILQNLGNIVRALRITKSFFKNYIS